MSNPEVNGMETQSTMPAKADDVEKLPALAVEMYKQDIKAKHVRQYFAPADATTPDIGFFIAMANSLGLNPWKREIHMVPFYDPTGRRKYAAVVGYEVYIGRAEKSENLDGWETEFDDEDSPSKCTITIWRKDWSHEFHHTTYMNEVIKLKKNGDPMATWASQPRFQLKKCTIAQGMRMCFPECAGLPYTFEEQAIIDQDMTQAMPVDIPEIESAQIEPDLDQRWRDFFDTLDETIKKDEVLRHRWQKRITGVESVKDWGETEFDLADAAIKRQDYEELLDLAKEKERMETELGKEEAAEPGITAEQKKEIEQRAEVLGFEKLSSAKFQKFMGEALGVIIPPAAMRQEQAASLIMALDAEVDRRAAEQSDLPFHDSQQEE